MIELVTMAEAKAHINEVSTDRDGDIGLKILMASGIVMEHMKLDDPPDEWEVADTSPAEYDIPWKVRAATLIVFAELFINREASIANVLSQTVKDLLYSRRDPTLA